MPDCNGSDRRHRAPPEREQTSAWCGMVRAYAESSQQEASKMRSVKADSAASRAVQDWDRINWPIVHRRARRLQTRIAKATRDQNWRRVKALQRFLVLSTVAQYVQMTVPCARNWRKCDRSTIDKSRSK
jgi:hypothetical protein